MGPGGTGAILLRKTSGEGGGLGEMGCRWDRRTRLFSSGSSTGESGASLFILNCAWSMVGVDLFSLGFSFRRTAMSRLDLMAGCWAFKALILWAFSWLERPFLFGKVMAHSLQGKRFFSSDTMMGPQSFRQGWREALVGNWALQKPQMLMVVEISAS
jgi:hypothetical protein